MKKKLVIMVLAVSVSTTAFAQFMISPNLGFGNVYVKTPLITESFSMSVSAFDCGLDLIFTGKSGFKFAFNNNVLLNGSLAARGYNVRGVKIYTYNAPLTEFYWNSQILFGYTHWINPNFNIGFGTGLAGGFGRLFTRDAELMTFLGLNFGVPIHLSIQYFFTSVTGIQLSILDTIALGMFVPLTNFSYSIGSVGFSNVFIINFGPVFRF